MNKTDSDFMIKAAEAGQAEVSLSSIAMKRAVSPDIKAFARRMVDQHTENNSKLQKLASQKGIPLPTSLNDRHQQVKDTLEGITGNSFDRHYMDAMLDDHRTVVAEFKHEKDEVEDGDLKAYVEKTLPVLESHLRDARSVTDRLGFTRSTSQGSRDELR